MAVEQVAKNIYRIPVPLPKNPLRELNSYLIRGEDRCLLIDTGFRMDECREALLAGLAELGVDHREVDFFITHLHSDHSGLAPDLTGEGRSIYVSEVDRRWLQYVEDREEHTAGLRRRLEASAMPADILDRLLSVNPAFSLAVKPGCEQYVGVYDGDVIPVGEYRLRCILTPGHAPGQMCLWEEAHRIMFTADQVLFDITPNITSWPELDNALKDYMDSLERMRQYPVELALPAHRAAGDYHRRIDQLLEHHHKRLQEVRDILTREPGLAGYEIAGRMTWIIRAKNWEDFPMAQKFFAVGECQSHLDYLERLGDIYHRPVDGVWKYYMS